jgi:hypothetical protein
MLYFAVPYISEWNSLVSTGFWWIPSDSTGFQDWFPLDSRTGFHWIPMEYCRVRLG